LMVLPEKVVDIKKIRLKKLNGCKKSNE